MYSAVKGQLLLRLYIWITDRIIRTVVCYILYHVISSGVAASTAGTENAVPLLKVVWQQYTFAVPLFRTPKPHDPTVSAQLAVLVLLGRLTVSQILLCNY